jgi:hypothetical protein
MDNLDTLKNQNSIQKTWEYWQVSSWYQEEKSGLKEETVTNLLPLVNCTLAMNG